MKNKKKANKIINNFMDLLPAICMGGGLVMILVIAFYPIFNEPEFKIHLDETEVDEIIACCLGMETIHSLENLSENVGIGSTRIKNNYSAIFCFPEENLEYFEVPCERIQKEEITKEWLDWNAECLECYDKKTNSMTLDGCSFEYDECFKYKFGKYIIEVK